MNCEICGKELKSAKAFPRHLTAIHKMTTHQYYDLYLKKSDNDGNCIECGKPTRFINMTQGYKQYCSLKCATPHIQEAVKATCLERYGVENFGQSEQAKAKTKKTMQELYGVDYYFLTDDCQSKAHSKEAIQKQKETCEAKYGVSCGFKTEQCIKAGHTKEADEKRKSTNKKRYGSEYTFKNCHTSEANAKRNETNLKLYGSTTNFSRPEVRTKAIANAHTKEACAKRTASRTDIPFINSHTDEANEKRIKTNINKYGYPYAIMIPEVKELARTGASTINAQNKRNITRKSNGWNRSSSEDAFKEVLNDLGIKYEYNYKSEKYPYKCDFYIPEKDLYIELNLFWTHGEHFYSEIEDSSTIELWKSYKNEYYDNAIKIWSETDIAKRDYAIENNLNYVVLWNNEQIEQFWNDFNSGKEFIGFIDYNCT